MTPDRQQGIEKPQPEIQESAILHQPESPKSKESPYADYEAKIGYLKTFMHAYWDLPIPNYKERSNDIKNENIRLSNALLDAQNDERFKADFELLKRKKEKEDESRSLTVDAPETDPKADTYKLLKDHSAEGLRHYIEIEEEIARLDSNPNVNFLDYFESGIDQIIYFRSRLRDQQRHRNSILDQEGWVFESNGKYSINVDGIEIPPDGVQFTNSSLVYYVGKAGYEKIINYYKDSRDEFKWTSPENIEFGMHAPGDCIVFINVQKDYPNYPSLPYGNYKPDYLDITEEMKTTARHEDLHSLFVGFKNLESSLDRKS